VAPSHPHLDLQAVQAQAVLQAGAGEAAVSTEPLTQMIVIVPKNLMSRERLKMMFSTISLQTTKIGAWNLDLLVVLLNPVGNKF